MYVYIYDRGIGSTNSQHIIFISIFKASLLILLPSKSYPLFSIALLFALLLRSVSHRKYHIDGLLPPAAGIPYRCPQQLVDQLLLVGEEAGPPAATGGTLILGTFNVGDVQGGVSQSWSKATRNHAFPLSTIPLTSCVWNFKNLLLCILFFGVCLECAIEILLR